MNGFKKTLNRFTKGRPSTAIKDIDLCAISGLGRPRGTGAESWKGILGQDFSMSVVLLFLSSSAGSIAGYFQIQG